MALQTKTISYGSLEKGSASNGYILQLHITEESVDPAANTSNVTFTLQLRSGSYNRFSLYRIGAKVVLSGAVAAQRGKGESSQYSLGYNSTVTLLSGTATVPHDADGTLSMTAEFSIDMDAGLYVPGPLSASGTMALTAIPRESTVAATAADIGQVSVLTVNRKNSAYSHTLKWQFGSLSGYLDESWQVTDTAVKLTDTVISFRLPESFYSQIPNSASGVCKLTLTTYAAGVQVGSPQYTSFTVTAAASACRPDITLTVTDENPVTLALTGDEKKLVKFVSTARCAVTAQAKNGASVAQIQVAGQTVSSGVCSIAQVEHGEIIATVTDSRGFLSTAADSAVAVIPYCRLTSNPRCSRTDPTSGDAVLRLGGQVFTGSFGAADNAVTATYQIGDGEPQPVSLEILDGSYQANIALSGLDYRSAHTITVTVSDALMCVSKTVTLGKGLPVFDWGEEDFAFHVPVGFDKSLAGLYIRKVQVWGGQSFRFQSKYTAFTDNPGNRQSVLIFGCRDVTAVLGILIVNSAGKCYWSGTEGVSATAENGVVTVSLGGTAYDYLTLISPDSITVL